MAASPEGVSVVVSAEHEPRVRDEVTGAWVLHVGAGERHLWAETGPKLTGSLLLCTIRSAP